MTGVQTCALPICQSNASKPAAHSAAPFLLSFAGEHGGNQRDNQRVQAAAQKLMDDGTYMKILKHWGVESGAADKAEINPTDLG